MKYILIAVFLGLVIYISFPSPKFPEPMGDFYQSTEPADTETPLRRGYYTNATRQEVIEHYQSEFKGYRLNYPPEEAQTIIRDQTKSTFLEEIVHPLRESIYINGFEPTDPQYAIVIKGTPWRQKVIVRYVRSNLLARLLVVALSGVAAVLLIKQWTKKS
ncbi:hypothetical protein COY30_01055 [Candidatus Woesebacteria bacterium CG_4_10_14_0_2_um_filter_44_9]|uniref:Uncharacterized protein n=1 Tax=Candidatus Woesebacteria bacterium CG_4_10_14_0_2_um_filter_44_9 TaxID=1975055 RepID=A0A2M7THV0_9BACT|nr:MAG: hypothetical protein COY30_01055 [Candidatus Woesebacteria bacterium CG_4_10_14_0_2_um_filter_44_9]